MVDEDRGTYSPPTEDNLSYESRRRPSRDQAPLTLIISGIFLVVLLIAVVVFYNSGLSHHGKAPAEVGDAVGEYKDTKVEDAKPLSDQDMTNGDETSARFAPSAEAPGERDVNPAVDVAPPPVAPITGPLPSQAGNSALGAPKSDDAASSPAANSPQAALTPAKPAMPALKPPVKTATIKPVTDAVAAITPAQTAKSAASKSATAKTDVAKADAPKSGHALAQIGAFSSKDIADKQANSVGSAYGMFLTGTSKHIEKVESNGATLYRTSFTGFESKEKASAFCSAMHAAGKDCFAK